MNHSEIVKRLSQKMGLSQSEIGRLLKRIAEIFQEKLDKGLGFTIPRLGTFKTHIRKPRKSYNPQKKKLVKLPKKRVVVFRPGIVLKKKIDEQGDIQ